MPGRKLRTRTQKPGSKSPEAPGVKPGKNKDCNMCIVCYNVFIDESVHSIKELDFL